MISLHLGKDALEWKKRLSPEEFGQGKGESWSFPAHWLNEQSQLPKLAGWKSFLR